MPQKGDGKKKKPFLAADRQSIGTGVEKLLLQGQ